MEVSCNKCADANSGGYGCDGECMWEEKKKTCVHKEGTENTTLSTKQR